MPLLFRNDIVLGGTAIGFYYQSSSGLISGRGLYSSFGTFFSIADMVNIYKDYFRETHRRSNEKCGIGSSVFGTNEDIDLVTNEFVYTVPNGHQRRHHDILDIETNSSLWVIVLRLTSFRAYLDKLRKIKIF